MSKILITGAGGQLGITLTEVLGHPDLGHEILLADKPGVVCESGAKLIALDITDPTAVESVVTELQPNVIINTAAYTDVDGAEEQPELALMVNTHGAQIMAEAAKRHGALLIHFSTDYVYDGTKGAAYLETDQVGPLCHYGATKLAGDQAVVDAMGAGGRYFILRISWLYSPFGQNFVRTIRGHKDNPKGLDVIHDQVGCPTYAFDVAEAIVLLINYHESGAFLRDDQYGLLHFCGDVQISWHQFAQEIVQLTGGSATVRQITTEEYGQNATRPERSVLNCNAIRALNVRTKSLHQSLEDCLQRSTRVDAGTYWG